MRKKRQKEEFCQTAARLILLNSISRTRTELGWSYLVGLPKNLRRKVVGPIVPVRSAVVGGSPFPKASARACFWLETKHKKKERERERERKKVGSGFGVWQFSHL